MNRAHTLNNFLPMHSAFDWGQCNCVHFVFAWVFLCEGLDLLTKSGLGPTPTPKAALRAIRERGRDLSDAFEKVYERPRQPKGTLILGDVVAASLGGSKQALGICTGSDAVFLSPQGRVFFRMEHMLHGWRVR